jgi:hypothetical protein
MNKLGTWAVAVALVSAVVNVVLSYLWFGLVRIEAAMPSESRHYTLDALSLNVTILGLIIGLVGFVLALMGFFGYVEIKGAAVLRAVETAREEATKVASHKMDEFIRQQQNSQATWRGQGQYPSPQPEHSSATRAEGE